MGMEARDDRSRECQWNIIILLVVSGIDHNRTVVMVRPDHMKSQTILSFVVPRPEKNDAGGFCMHLNVVVIACLLKCID